MQYNINDSSSMTVQQLLDEGLHCYHNRKLDDALYYFEKLLHVDSDNTELLHTIMKLLQEMEDFDKASLYGKKLLVLSPNNEDFLLSQAENLFHINNYKEALPLYSKLRELYPASIHLLDRLTFIYKREYNYSEVKSKFSDEKESSNQSFIVSEALSLSMILLNDSQFDEAKLLLESILLIDFENTEAYGAYGVLLERSENYEKAIFYLDKAVFNSHFEFLTSLTKCLEKVYGIPAVVVYLEELVSKFPEDLLNKKLLGFYYYRNGDYFNADRVLSFFSKDHISDIYLFKYKVLSRFKLMENENKVLDKDELFSMSNNLFSLWKVLPNDNEVTDNVIGYYLNLGEIEKVYSICNQVDKRIPDNKTNIWNKHCYFRANRDVKAFYESYIAGRHIRLNFPYENIENKIWNGEDIKGKRVVILREQGIGDEIYFASNYEWIAQEANSVSAFCRARLKPSFERLFPLIDFYTLEGNDGCAPKNFTHPLIDEADIIVLSGDLLAYHYQKKGVALFNKKYFKVEGNLNKYWQRKLEALIGNNKPKVGLAWRSGLINAYRSTHYLNADEVAFVIKQIPEVEFINCMYEECSEEIDKIHKKSNREIHHLEELDQKNDFESTAAMISNLDLVVGTHITPVILAEAVGTKTVICGADYLRENGVVNKESFHYPGTPHISLPVNDSAKRAEALDALVNNIKASLNI